MTNKRKAMVEELMDWISGYRKDFGCRPTQQEIDDFMYSWEEQ